MDKIYFGKLLDSVGWGEGGALQRQFRLYSFSGNSAASAQISTCLCLWAIYTYIPRIGPHISSSRKGRPIVGIYNSLTDTWMWKLRLRPQYSFSGNICFKFSAFCLCSVGVVSDMLRAQEVSCYPLAAVSLIKIMTNGGGGFCSSCFFFCGMLWHYQYQFALY